MFKNIVNQSSAFAFCLVLYKSFHDVKFKVYYELRRNLFIFSMFLIYDWLDIYLVDLADFNQLLICKPKILGTLMTSCFWNPSPLFSTLHGSTYYTSGPTPAKTFTSGAFLYIRFFSKIHLFFNLSSDLHMLEQINPILLWLIEFVNFFSSSKIALIINSYN